VYHVGHLPRMWSYGTPYRLWHKSLHHRKGYLLKACEIHWIFPLKCHWTLYQSVCTEAYVHMRRSMCSASQHVLRQNLTICSELAHSNLQLASSTPPYSNNEQGKCKCLDTNNKNSTQTMCQNSFHFLNINVHASILGKNVSITVSHQKTRHFIGIIIDN
jgi:hypothetical protein